MLVKFTQTHVATPNQECEAVLQKYLAELKKIGKVVRWICGECELCGHHTDSLYHRMFECSHPDVVAVRKSFGGEAELWADAKNWGENSLMSLFFPRLLMVHLSNWCLATMASHPGIASRAHQIVRMPPFLYPLVALSTMACQSEWNLNIPAAL